MTTSADIRRPLRPAAGFTLPAVLVVAAAMLVLAVGILAVTTVERRTARSYVDLERAELAVRAGFEDLRGVLLRDAANDDFLIVQSLPGQSQSGRGATPRLFLVRPEVAGDDYSYRYQPLFSTASVPPASARLLAPALEGLDEGPAGSTNLATHPHLDSARLAWLPVKDDEGRMVGRYAYLVEDLQSRLDPTVAGNTRGEDGSHARSAWPFPAPGVRPPGETDGRRLDIVALAALDSEWSPGGESELATRLIEGRPWMVSPGSLLAAAGFEDPPARGADGRFTDPAARAIDEHLSPPRAIYFEQARIPFAPGIDPSMAGRPKLDLNTLLETGGDEAVEQIADQIERALPDFATERKGGFPDDYLRTLAANLIDYADSDRSATLLEGSYRGLDAYPLVSEFLMRFRWENVLTENGRKYILLSASTYVELWNMTNLDVSGSAELTYETRYTFPLGANPEVALDDLEDATHDLSESEGRRWFPSIQVSLRPNEYRVFHCGTVTYKIDAGPAAVFIPSPLQLSGETFGSSEAGYRLRWNGQVVDQSRGGVHRNDSSLNFPMDTANQPRQRVRATVPGHSHTRGGVFRNNMGDPRMAYYLLAPQDANAYPNNYSPNRRNVRWQNIYRGAARNQHVIYGRVLPSEWPDGGHNSFYGSNAFATTDQRVNPDDPRFFSGLPQPRAEEAPMRLSKAGAYFSPTELGRIYDPIMWEVDQPPGPNLPWGDVLGTTSFNPDFGGGNSLRIGRPEHPRFDLPGLRASHLLDLFDVGTFPVESGSIKLIDGHVNLNTATRDTLRALAAGWLEADPALSRRTGENHETNIRMAPMTQPLRLSAPSREREADRIADAILRSRPFASLSEAAHASEADGTRVFGNRALFDDSDRIHWTDSAASELFARVHDASTVRSRNFRVWIIGQSLAPASPTDPNPTVLAESRRVFTLAATTNEFFPDGTVDPETLTLDVRHENAF